MDFENVTDPLGEVDRFRSEAERAGLYLPEAMTLATVDGQGRPRARVVLLRGRVGRAVHFYTNYESDKAREIEAHPHVALCIHYPSLALQARIEGTAARLSAEESDEYFASRPRDRQLGAWASRQSAPLSSRADLEKEFREAEARFSGAPVPRPPYWGGYAVTAENVELWLGRDGRLHDRARYVFQAGAWQCTRLQP